MSHPSIQHGQEAPSVWVQQYAHLIPSGGHVLDLACGYGRHMKWLSSQSYKVTGVDKDANALQGLSNYGHTLCHDLENYAWPFTNQSFDGIVVTHYLWRPLWPSILLSLKMGGVLIYETFSAGNEAFGKPSRPDFLLQNGELLMVFKDLHVVAYENGLLAEPQRVVQRIVAITPTPHPHQTIQAFNLSR
ncbi:MAG: class I SAM-dependent methyltransferase [Limnohabitans sp.]|nr:class I SAM-dependent methyltransferase [Limnohabitans sp.]